MDGLPRNPGSELKPHKGHPSQRVLPSQILGNPHGHLITQNCPTLDHQGLSAS